MLTRIVIIEDEPLASRELERTVRDLMGEFILIEPLFSVAEAIAYFSEETTVDLIFSDIQLGDGNSFEIFEKVTITCPIVFVTAFDEYAIKAFKTNGIDYILKPYDKSAVKSSIQKCLSLTGSSPVQKSATTFRGQVVEQTIAKSILVYQKDELIPIDIQSIQLIFLEFGVVKIYCADGKKYTYQKTLAEMEEKLSSQFFRVNKQTILNRSIVQSITPNLSRKFTVNIRIPFHEKIILSRLKAKEFMEWLQYE